MLSWWIRIKNEKKKKLQRKSTRNVGFSMIFFSFILNFIAFDGSLRVMYKTSTHTEHSFFNFRQFMHLGHRFNYFP